MLKGRNVLKIEIYLEMNKRMPHKQSTGLGDPRGTASHAGACVDPLVASLPTFLAKQESRAPGRGLFAAGIRTILRFCSVLVFGRKDTPSVKNQRFLPPPSVREARVQCKHDGVTDCHGQQAAFAMTLLGRWVTAETKPERPQAPCSEQPPKGRLLASR